MLGEAALSYWLNLKSLTILAPSFLILHLSMVFFMCSWFPDLDRTIWSI